MPDSARAGNVFPVEALAQTWGQRFRTVVRAHPNRIALAYPDRPITYAELDAKTDRIAAALRRVAPRPHSHIAVLVPDGLDAGRAVDADLQPAARPGWPRPASHHNCRPGLLRSLRRKVEE